MALIAHYRLNGDAKDSVGNNHGTVVGSVTWPLGKVGKAAKTSITRDYVRIPHDPHLSSRAFGVRGEVTLAAWVKLNSYNNYGLIVGKNSGGSYSNTTNAIWVNGGGVLMVVGSNENSNPSGGTSYAVAGKLVTLGKWHHIAGVLDNDRVYFYVDGVKVADEANNVTRTRSENNADIIIGGPRDGGDEGVDGEIQDVRIYDHAASEREVRDMALAPVLSACVQEMDNSDNSGTFLTVPDAPTVTGDMSLAFWIYPTASGRQTVWNNGYGGEGTVNFEGHGGNDLRFYSGPNGGNTSGYVSFPSTPIPLNQWTHAVVVRNLTTGEGIWYLNGEVDVTRTYSFPTTGVTDFDLQIGTGYTSDFVGKLRQVLQFASVLSPEQVRELYLQRAAIDSKGSLHTMGLSESVAYVSPLSTSQTSFYTGNGYNNTSSQSSPCSGAVTFEQALQHAHDQGGRLPTLEELENNATRGTGCGYDAEYCWTCDQGDHAGEHWVGRGHYDANSPPMVISNESTAHVRFVADNDLDRPDPVMVNDEVINKWMAL